MLVVKGKSYRGDGTGMCWPNSPSGTGTVEAVFGPRPFSGHVATVGFDYDLHVGIDVVTAVGATIYAPITGAVCRRHFSHFGFEDAAQLSEFALTAPSSSLTAALGTNVLNLTCSRVGAISGMVNIDKYQLPADLVDPIANDWVLEMELNATISLAAGAIGIEVTNAANTEFIGLEYDGTTFTRRGVGTATFTANGGTTSASSKTWMRITYTLATTTVTWLHSTDGVTWTSMATEVGRVFTTSGPHMKAGIYWRSGDTNATPYNIAVSTFNLADENRSVGRFGNWLQIGGPSAKVCLVHFQSLSVALGRFVSVGQALGIAGQTGFDATSGRINAEHCHMEYVASNVYEYSRASSINPMSAAYLPRTNVSNNVSVARTTGNDPDAVDSHKLTITVTRADQDFDLNSITLTGNTTSRTINFDTRAGLNANVDIPKQSGVYIVASSFNEVSATYVVTVYFNKSVVGSTFVSYALLDSQGTTVASG